MAYILRLEVEFSANLPKRLERWLQVLGISGQQMKPATRNL
ncbi:MAG: hypothetical protein QM668_04620 [Agriterribacter sp.]